MDERITDLKNAWDERGERLGSTKRAVLFKRFPDWLNESIHRRHVNFVLAHAPTGPGRVLDVGCGYGRISRELAARNPRLEFQGVDLCSEFAREYEKTVGPCFEGPIQEFPSEQRYDYVVIVTTLMYLDDADKHAVLQRLRGMLDPGGRIVCIEPASELFVLWRRLTGRVSASPTGGTVSHFLAGELRELFVGIDRTQLVAEYSVMLIPPLKWTSVHHAIAIAAN